MHRSEPWKHYVDQKRRSAEMAFMAKNLGLQFDQARNNRLDKVCRFLRNVKGSRRYELNIIIRMVEFPICKSMIHAAHCVAADVAEVIYTLFKMLRAGQIVIVIFAGAIRAVWGEKIGGHWCGASKPIAGSSAVTVRY